MLRQILYHVVPMLVPFGLYAAYLWLRRRQGATEGWREAPLTWLFIAGFVLVIASFFVLRLESEAPKDIDYRPPAYVDGRIVPGGARAPVPEDRPAAEDPGSGPAPR